MSIWTQIFLVNLIVFSFLVFMDIALLEMKVSNWLDSKGRLVQNSSLLYIYATLTSIPAWFIYQVATA